MNVKVSVVVPVYNGEKTIKKCLDSLNSQTLSEMEFIIVNDGSTDATLSIINSYPDERIKVISIQNSGQGVARNKGVQLATGEYIGFLDADDTIEPNMYEIMLSRAKEFSADIVQCAICDIVGDEKKVRSSIDRNVEIKNTDTYIKDYFYNLIHTNEVCNKIFKRTFLKDNNLYFLDTRKVYSEDLALNLESLKYLKRISYVSLPLYNYYITEQGHCKKSPIERITKIWCLYRQTINNINGLYNKKAIMSMAVINTLIYSLDIGDASEAKAIITSIAFKRYCIASALYKRKIKHIIIMLAIILFPYRLNRIIINKYFKY
ncbi:MAG: glycosyltransferase [Eubacteriales bacterium]|nr:glycosyltransferase [Eubacteriales bacterium]